MNLDPLIIDTPERCWPWTGSKTKGYADVRTGGKTVRLHRAVYELVCGPIPPDHDVHHTCENRACVNPSHLSVVPHRDHAREHHPEIIANILRTSQERQAQTHCKRGHEFTPENTRQRGHLRSCRACDRLTAEATRHRLRQRELLDGVRFDASGPELALDSPEDVSPDKETED